MSNDSTTVSNPLATLTDEKLARLSEECRLDLFNLDYCSSGGGLFRSHEYYRENWTKCGSAACRAIHARWAVIKAEQDRRAKEVARTLLALDSEI